MEKKYKFDLTGFKFFLDNDEIDSTTHQTKNIIVEDVNDQHTVSVLDNYIRKFKGEAELPIKAIDIHPTDLGIFKSILAFIYGADLAYRTLRITYNDSAVSTDGFGEPGEVVIHYN